MAAYTDYIHYTVKPKILEDIMKREKTQVRRGTVLALVLSSLMLAMQMLGVSIVGAQEIFDGPPPITPRWAFEPWVWEDNHNTQDSIVNLVDQYQSRHIPVGAVIIDSPWSTCYNSFEWNTTQYPDPEQMIDSFHEEEVRVLLWLTGFLNETSVDTEIQECVDSNGKSLFDFVGPPPAGQDYSVDNGDVHWWWKCKGTTPCGRHIDFTNDAAKDWWHMLMDKVLVLGIDGWKTDRGAQSLGAKVMTSINNEMSNEDFRKYYYADIFDYSTTDSMYADKEKIIFARPIGPNDSINDNTTQRYAPVSKLSAGWGGDYSGNFDGLTKQMNHMYDSAKAGYGAPGIEVGGFFDDKPTKFSLIRYAQLGALSPIMENGGQNGGCGNPQCTIGEHLPWHWDDDKTVDIYRYYATLHSELTPYLFSYSVEAHLTGDSIIRGSDNSLSHHRLGEEIFVSVIDEEGDSEGNVKKPVIFPSEGSWIDYWDQGQLYTGGSSIPGYEVSLEKYPIFIKAGAVIPTSDLICTHCWEKNGGVFGLPFTIDVADYHDPAEFTDPNIVLNIYPFADSSFLFHRPLGDGIDCEDVKVEVKESAGTIQVIKNQNENPTQNTCQELNREMEHYKFRVKSFSEPNEVFVDGESHPFDYDENQYVIINVVGSEFRITINGLTGYSGIVNNVNAGSGTKYEVINNGLVLGATQYVDRSFTFTDIPENLQNATYIKTANDDKLDTVNPFLTFDVNEDVIIYVALDDRVTKPLWLDDMGFEDSSLHLSAEGTPGPFSLYSAPFPAGMVHLGGNEGGVNSSMYTVAIVPLKIVEDPPIPQTNWVGSVDSEELVGEDGRGVNAFDGKPGTIWHTEWSLSDPPHPHHLQIDLGAVYDVTGLRYLPRQDGSLNGTIGDYAVSVSLDGETWGVPVATGKWTNDSTEKKVLFGSVTGRYIRLEAFTEVNGNPWTSAAEVNVLGVLSSIVEDPPIPQTNWVGSVDSEELVGEDGRGVNAFDGKPGTIWHTEWSLSDPPHPHHLQIDLGAVYDVTGLRYLPRQDGSLNGTIGDYAVSVSLDGETWGVPVATGKWTNDSTEKKVLFGSVTGRYIRLEAFTEVNGNPWTSAAEVNVLGVLSSIVEDPPIPQTNWVGSVDSEELVGEDGRGVNAFDGKPGTIWHTEWSLSDPPHPHHLQIDLGAVYDVTGLRYLPRQDGSLNGTIGDYAVSVSLDGETWGVPVATGKWTNDSTEKKVLFGSVTGRYIRLEAFTEVNGNPWTSAAEVNVLGSVN